MQIQVFFRETKWYLSAAKKENGEKLKELQMTLLKQSECPIMTPLIGKIQSELKLKNKNKGSVIQGKENSLI